MKESAIREQLAMHGRSLHDRGLAGGSTGNMSVRLEEGSFIATPTNACLGRLDPARLSKLDAEGRHVDGDKPTKETFLHLAMYRRRPRAAAVVHLHCTHSVAVSCLAGLDAADVLPAITPYYVMRIGKCPLVPYFRPGDEALGAAVEQPADGAPLLRQHLLEDLNLDALRRVDPTRGGRMPLFYRAVEKVVQEIGRERYVLATLRGPLLGASQLRGVQEILMDLIDHPEEAEKILDFTAETALRLGQWLAGSGAHGLLLGEATCSPNFISPRFYRRFVLPRHQRLVRGLKAAGWRAVGLHICGDTTAILEDVISTGVDFLDLDYQVPAIKALAMVRNRIATPLAQRIPQTLISSASK